MSSVVEKFIYNGVIYSKKNNKRIITNKKTGKPQIVSSQQAKEMEAEMQAQFSMQAMAKGWGQRVANDDDHIYEVTICITEKDHTRRDLDNQATSILDALVCAMILPDDSVKYLHSLHVVYMGVDKYDPKAEITIEQCDRNAVENA